MIFEQIRKVLAFTREASAEYERSRLYVLTQTLWLRVRHKKRLGDIRLWGLLSKDSVTYEHGLAAGGISTQNWLHRINDPKLAESVDFKPKFYERCKSAGIRVPKSFATGLPSPDLVRDLPDSFLVKPVYGSGGYGVDAFKRVGDAFESWDGELLDLDCLVDRLINKAGGREMIFQEWLKVHSSLVSIAFRALLTVRIVTIRGRSIGQEPSIIMAALKLPNPDSLADNSCSASEHAGHIEIDINTGQPMSLWSANPSGFGVIERKTLRDRGIHLSSLRVPFWEETRRMALELADLFPELPSLGWDIGQSEEGPVAIEGNSAWGAPYYPSGLQRIAVAMKQFEK